MPLFSTQAKISLDPIMGLIQLASKDSHPDKFVAIVGSAADDNGELIVPEAVKKVAKELTEKGIDMNYAPSPGINGLSELMTEEILGKKNQAKILEKNIFIASVTTCAGTNAIANTLVACTSKDDEIITHNPHWAGYDSVINAIERKALNNFEILDSDENFNLEAFENCLNQCCAKSPNAKLAILLNTPFDNPLGKDFGKETWNSIAKVLAKFSSKEILLILDAAYIDFGPEGKDYRRLDFLADFFETINNPKFNLIIAGTVSKSFAMYSARVGVAALLTTVKENADAWKNVAGGVVRGTFSNANRFAQELALKILQSPALLAEVHDFQFQTAKLLKERTSVLLEALKDLPDDFKVIKPDSGFFVSIKIKDKKIAKEFYERLLAEHIYVPLISDQFLRIPVCGLSAQQLKNLASKLCAMSKTATAA
ncbi:MAG: aminotransferase class I/II-fold pyridoxal phosphate-dependent enzyme [Candidatus Caenarcaniphilales bacterium]|jgi:aspartate/tyrosine/aromatic aminotransferase|nr:aminotransferase class I/II-fold pyridoxal phosphate-dependent enzyme [Candidatus Caenarcaniphilales bacterium]